MLHRKVPRPNWTLSNLTVGAPPNDSWRTLCAPARHQPPMNLVVMCGRVRPLLLDWLLASSARLSLAEPPNLGPDKDSPLASIIRLATRCAAASPGMAVAVTWKKPMVPMMVALAASALIPTVRVLAWLAGDSINICNWPP